VSAPAPRSAAGRTRCPRCEQRFTDTPDRPTTLIEGTEPSPARPGYSAGRADQRHAVEIRWHVDCLADFEAANAALRAQVERDRLAAVATIAAGLEPAARDAALAALPEADRATVLDLIAKAPS
jgi:hypothetical protein